MQSEKDIKASLANISFETLLKANRTTGVDKHSKRIKKVDPNTDTVDLPKRDKKQPKEASAKTWVNPFKVVMKSSRKITRDPRFDDQSGKFNQAKFYETYNFIEKMKGKENKAILTNLKKSKKKKHAKKFTEEDKIDMAAHFADNKQGLGRLKQIRTEKYAKKDLKKELQEKTGLKHKFVSKFAVKKRLADMREAKKIGKINQKTLK